MILQKVFQRRAAGVLREYSNGRRSSIGCFFGARNNSGGRNQEIDYGAQKYSPCFFGSALKSEGVKEFLLGLADYTQKKTYPDAFGAKVFKITRDQQGNRLTFLKVTGGKLKTKEALNGGKDGEHWEEKINQIRIYSGEKYRVAEEAAAGDVCALIGLTHTKPGEGLGIEKSLFPSCFGTGFDLPAGIAAGLQSGPTASEASDVGGRRAAASFGVG